MYRLIRFFKRIFPVLLFLILEVAAINYYANSTSYTKAKMITASNKAAGWVHSMFGYVGDWFTIGRDNRRLVERLAETEELLTRYREAVGEEGYAPDSLTLALPGAMYFYSAAKVINNTVNRQENFFILDKGMKDGVEKDMSVTSVDGNVAGYVVEASSNFAVCMSILNRDFRIGGRVKGKEYIGSVFWDGTDTRFVTLADIPRYAPLEVGDTIVSAYSSRFPSELMIGKIEGLNDSPDGASYWVKVRLGTEIARLSDVILIKYTDSQELEMLEGQYFNNAAQNQ